MSIKDLFYRNKKYKVVTSSSLDDIGNKVESADYVQEYHDERSRFYPTVDFGNPDEFSFYGSAEKYYTDTIQRIYNQYPYDGSLKERLQFINSSSYIDKWFFENEYPRTNGFITLGQNWGNASLGSTTSFTADSNDYGNDTYVVSPKPQYLFFKGGPHAASIRPYDGKSLEVADYKNPLHKANIFDQNRDLESNLQIDGVSGSTVEFWFKAGGTAGGNDKFLGPSPNLAFFDLWNSGSLTAGSDNPATYGRFLVEMRRQTANAATATIVITDAGGVQNADTFGIQNSAGTTTTYRINSGGSWNSQSGGAAGGTIDVFIGGAGGGATGKIRVAAAINAAIAATSGSPDFTSTTDGVDTVTITQSTVGEAGNKTNSDSISGATVNSFTGGLDKELDKFKGDKLFYITIMSGNSGVDRAPIGAGTLTGSYPLDEWNHYAVSFQNNGSTTADKQINIKLYINGQLQETVTTGSSINEISVGPHLANLGAYIYAPNTASVSGFTAGGRNQEGIGCVSGSFDEFRFWKERRDSERIFQNYNSHIGGGTNTDPANNHLGVYFKFNEGITATGSTDQTVLDYSGRVSNGLIKNYDSTLSMRSTGSAMVQAGAASAEFKDPIIYYYHPEVKSTEEQFVLKGKEHDYDNANMLYYSLPDWISTEDENTQIIKNLFQVIGAYFDQLHILISDIPRLKDIRYMSGSTDRPLPFANELLESTGFFAPEIFPNASILNNFLDRDENGNLYDRPLHEVKNFIYENIYHNLTYINKSKGTTKAIRNLIRCFGVDDELFKINFYSDNSVYKPETSYNFTTVRKNFADFESQGRNNAVVFQSTASLNTNSSGYLNHSDNDSAGFDSDIGMTFETEVHFGSPPAIDNPNYDSGSFGYLTSSMFGVHTAKTSASDLAWATNDYGNFQVYAVRDELKSPNSKNAYFQIKSTAGGILASNEITSSLFYDVYDNQIWNFAVVVKPAEYPNSTYVSGSTDDYIVEFHGYNMVSDIIANSFMVTASVTGQAGRRFVSSKKRFYVGAHRQDFAGSVIDPSNIKASGCRIWTIPLNEDEIIAHARDTTNYGVHNPYENAFLNENKSTFSGKVPRIKSLALHWDFENVTGSNEHGEFLVEDLSSGSSDERYGDWSAILEKQHTGQGMFFENSDSGSISREYVATAKTQFFENLNNENFVQVLEKDDEYFGKRVRPIRYFFAIEKSMYQSINDEMIDLFGNIAGLQSYASIIGEPVNKYRKQYKKLNFIRSLFFDKVKNTPDLEKYVEFYKWFDDAVSAMILNLIPATSDFAGVQNVVESHILERNKYEHKFPTMDSKLPDISGSIEAINKLKYNWKFGHAPTPPEGGGSGGDSHGNQNINTLWWKQRAERNTDAPNNFGSGDSGVDNTRGFIHSASYETFSRHQNSPVDFNILEFRKEGPKNYRAFFPHLQYDSTNVIEIRESGVADAIAFSGSDDHKELYPPKKFKAALFGNLGTIEGEETNKYLFPFNMYSSSLDTKVSREFKEGLIITDQHRDTYHTFENEPLQGPFTNTHVGGNQYRHISLNKGEEEKRLSRNRFSRTGRLSTSLSITTKLDDDETRPEGWIIKLDNPDATTASLQDAIIIASGDADTDTVTITMPEGLGNDGGKTIEIKITNLMGATPTANQINVTMAGGSTTGIASAIINAINGVNDAATVKYGSNISGGTSTGINGLTAAAGSTASKITLTASSVGIVGNSVTLAETLTAGSVNSPLAGGSDGNRRLKLTSPDFDGADKPRATYLRDETAKRPVNIRNIHYTTASQDLGNFTNNYEVVMTSGRNINNQYFKENLGVSVTGSRSSVISGTVDFTLPDRSVDAYRTKTVIAERFSAPGDPSTLSRGYLDIESESFSVYNNLNHRNLTVRSALRTMLTSSVVHFGLSDSLEPIANDVEQRDPFRRASFHKVNKNSAKRIELKELNADGNPASSILDDDNYQTGSVSDNYYVQHQIPQSVMQYSWITASATSGPFGFEKPNAAYASLASDDITFSDQADIGVFNNVPGAANTVGVTSNDVPGGLNVIKGPFVPLNTLSVINEDNLTRNTVSFDLNREFTSLGEDTYTSLGVASSLNLNLLKTNGPYGHASWRQWRTGNHPVSMYHKKNNIISVAVQKMGFNSIGKPIVAEDQLISVTEAPLTSKFKPLVHKLNLKNGGNISVKHSFSNNLARPANQLVNITSGPDLPFYDALGIDESGPTPPVFKLRDQQVYDDLYDLYKEGKTISDNLNPLAMPSEAEPFVKPVRSLTYSETVYPKEDFAYLATSRTRNNYGQTRDDLRNNTLSQHRIFWRDAHVDRLRHDLETSLNSMNFKIDKDVTKGWPSRDTSNVSGGILAVDRSNPSPTTTVTASGGSAALSIWPLDTDGEGSAVYAFASSGSDKNTGDARSGGPNYYIGRGAGELSNSTDWTLYYKDYPATASLGYNFVQMLHFSGAYQSNDTGGSLGDYNKSPKVPTYQTPQLIGTNPWYDNYEEYSEDVRFLAKDHTILPEFKISDLMQVYLDQGSVTTVAKSFLNLPGANTTNTGSALTIDSLTDSSFAKTYIESKPFNYYHKFVADQSNAETPLVPNSFTVSFDGIMKMLPYQGFYPALRTLQLGQMFSQSYGPFMGSPDRNDWPTIPDGIINKATKTAALVQPWYNPGIMFNTIKSGIAVDWPVFKGDQAAIPAASVTSIGLSAAKFRGSGFISGTTDATDTSFGGPNFRFPFESLVEPERFIPVSGGVDDSSRIAHLAPQWKNFFTLTADYMQTTSAAAKEDAGFMTKEAGGGVVNNPTVSIKFRSTANPTNGTSIGINTPIGASITGTVNTGAGTSTDSVIGLSGVSSAADRASRFYDFVKLAISGSTAKRSLHAEYNTGDDTVHLFLPGGSQYNDIDITDADNGVAPATFIDNVTIGPIASSSSGVKFNRGQDANFAFFDWIGDSTPYYKYAIHNFLAEVPNFFLEPQKLGSNLTSFISKPQSKWSNFENGKKYYMDIVLSKNKEMVMFEGPASFMGPGQGSGDAAKTGAARGMHYGPAMRWTNESSSFGDDFERNLADPAFAAWTPPYFYGTSIARIEFDPSTITTANTDAFTIEEIFDKSTVTYINLCERHPEFAQLGTEEGNTSLHAGSANTPASASFMHLSSSVELFGKAFPNLIKYNSNNNNVLGLLSPQEQEQGEDPVWVISPKFECPVLNFSGNAGPAKNTSFSQNWRNNEGN